jgi:hypothetical protein
MMSKMLLDSTHRCQRLPEQTAVEEKSERG